MLDVHTLAIVIHALSATGAFVVGVVLLFEGNAVRQLQFGRIFVVLLVLLEVFLVIAILTHVTHLPLQRQIIFGALSILGLYLIWRAVQAVSILRDHPGNRGAAIDHIGFDLISLFDAFAIVSAIDLQASGWLVAGIAIGAVALGVYAIKKAHKAIATRRS